VERYRMEFFGLCGKCARTSSSRTHGVKPSNGHAQAGRLAAQV
jgi:hypothetical protein